MGDAFHLLQPVTRRNKALVNLTEGVTGLGLRVTGFELGDTFALNTGKLSMETGYDLSNVSPFLRGGWETRKRVKRVTLNSEAAQGR